MLTLAEHQKRCDSISNKWHTVHAAGMTLFTEYCAIDRYADKLPLAIGHHVRAAAKAKWNHYKETGTLRNKLDAAQGAMWARPWLCELADGTTVECPGFLGNGEATSTDENEALAMYKAYRAIQAFEPPTLNEEELPF